MAVFPAKIQFLILSIGLAGLSGCGGGNTTSSDSSLGDDVQNQTVLGSMQIVSEVRPLANFSKVHANVGQITITQCAPSAVVSMDDNLIDLLRTDIDQETLTIWYDGSFSSDHGAQIALCADSLVEITAAGAPQISIEMEVTDLVIDAQGTASIDLSAVYGNVGELSISGGSVIEVAGFLMDYSLDISGSSQFRGQDLVSDSVQVFASGSSSAEINTSTITGSLTEASRLLLNQSAFEELTLELGATVEYYQ